MNILESFISECKEGTGDGGDKKEVAETEKTGEAAPVLGGDLLVSGCCDWEHMAAKTAAGLEGLHRVTLPRSSPVQETFSSPSSCHLFILLADQRLFAMGKNDRGQLGIGSREVSYGPVEVTTPWSTEHSLVKIATGKIHTLFLLSNGDVWGCGASSCGQLGLGAGKKAFDDVLVPVHITTLTDIRDISCGAEFSMVCTRARGQVLTFGHPEYGQLGNGKTGEFIAEAKKGLQFDYVTSPFAIRVFLVKDSRGNVTRSVPADEVKVCAVAAGKNHCLCLEDWRDNECGESGSKSNRVFSWGFGGYGRLGHNGATDEMVPREVSSLHSDPPNPQRQIRHIFAGSTYSLAISLSRHTYFFGILPNSPRGEACTYPRIMQELYDYPATQVGGGSSWVMVNSNGDDVIFWGTPTAGKFGLEGNAKSSANPKFVSATVGLRVQNLVCGYGHCCMVVGRGEGQTKEKYDEAIEAFPALELPDGQGGKEDTAVSSASGKGKGKGKGKSPAAAVAVNNKRKKEPAASSKAKRGKK